MAQVKLGFGLLKRIFAAGHALTVKEPESLPEAITQAIDRWHASNPDLTVLEILQALEEIRGMLTEALVKDAKP